MPLFRKESPAWKVAKLITKGHNFDPYASAIDAFILRKAESLAAPDADRRQGQIDMSAAHRLRDWFSFPDPGRHFLLDFHVDDLVHVRFVTSSNIAWGDRWYVYDLVNQSMVGMLQFIVLKGGELVELLDPLDEAQLAPDQLEECPPSWTYYGCGVMLKDVPARFVFGPLPPEAGACLVQMLSAEENTDVSHERS
jgi:hypothetical protein